MAQVAVGLLAVGLVGLGELLAPEVLFLLLIGERVPAVEVVHPALGDDVAAACARVAVGHDGHGRLILVGGVAGAVLEAGHVQRVAVDERGRLTSDGHVARQGGTGVVLRLPHLVLVVVVQPQQQLFLCALGFAPGAVLGLDGHVGLEVVRHVIGQLRQQARSEAERQVDALRVARSPQVGKDGRDHTEIRALDAAQVDVPLVGAHLVEDGLLRRWHLCSLRGSMVQARATPPRSPSGDTARLRG